MLMKDNKETIESSLQRLEKIVSELGGKEVSVEDGLLKFKEGVELIKQCRAELGHAENEFKKLKAELDNENEQP